MQRFLSLLRLVPPGTGAAARLNGQQPRLRGYIRDQRTLAGFRLGRGRFDRTGCEAVAVYNVLLALGRPTPLPEVIRQLTVCRCLMLGGLAGADPFTLAGVIRGAGLDVTAYGEKHRWADFRAAADAGQGRAYLLSYWDGPFNLHTVALVPGREGGFTVYNGNLAHCQTVAEAAPDLPARFLWGCAVGQRTGQTPETL